MRKSKGYSLIELVVTIGIIGVLSAIALPRMSSMKERARRAEVPALVHGIKTAELAYEAAFDELVSAAPQPSGAPGKAAVAWPEHTEFEELGWQPDGMVRGRYQVELVDGSDFVVSGRCDVDGDGAVSAWTASRLVNATMTTAADVY